MYGYGVVATAKIVDDMNTVKNNGRIFDNIIIFLLISNRYMFSFSLSGVIACLVLINMELEFALL